VSARATAWGAYKSITDALRRRIDSGEFATGSLLPSEAALTELHSGFHLLSDDLVDFVAGMSKRLREQGISRFEISIEAAMRETDLPHHLSDANSTEPGAAHAFRGGLDDAPIVRRLLSNELRSHVRIVTRSSMIVLVLLGSSSI